MSNIYLQEAEESLQEHEIKSRLQVAKQLLEQHLESAVLYSWALVEATLRLVAEREGASLQKFDSLYLIKQLTTEGVISRTEYQLLMNARSVRNAVAHGFKTKQLTQDSVSEVIQLTEQLLNELDKDKEAG